jgi:hypothetical protein
MPTRTPPYGRLDRLNGPVDNPLSSCLSCHAREVAPYVPSKAFPRNEAEADDPANNFFTNTAANSLYAGAPAGAHPLDYSLQLPVGVANFPSTTPAHWLPQMSMKGVTPRGGEVDAPETGSAALQPAAQVTPPAPPGPNWWLWGGGAVLLVILLFVHRRRSAAPAHN